MTLHLYTLVIHTYSYFIPFSVFSKLFLKGNKFQSSLSLWLLPSALFPSDQLLDNHFSNVYLLTAQYSIWWHIKGTTELTVLFSFHSFMISSMEFVFFTVDAHNVSTFIFVFPRIFFLITVRLLISVLVKLNVLSFPNVYHFILKYSKSIWESWGFVFFSITLSLTIGFEFLNTVYNNGQLTIHL